MRRIRRRYWINWSNLSSERFKWFKLHFYAMEKRNKPGPAKVGAIFKAQKKRKDFKVSKYYLLQHSNFFLKKSQNAEKKLKWGPFGIVRYCMLRGKPFWFSSLGQRGQFMFVELLVELFWSLQLYRKTFF